MFNYCSFLRTLSHRLVSGAASHRICLRRFTAMAWQFVVTRVTIV